MTERWNNDLGRERFALPTGVELDVMLGGPADAPAIFFLHGFPESSRTWRHQMVDFVKDYRVLAPDQRGFARSSKPSEVSDYTHDKPVGDLFALADALGIETFTLVGHDWGGAIAWAAALGNPARVTRLAIVNAPHPFIFQKSVFDDMGQREASQYIRSFRMPGMAEYFSAKPDKLFDKTFGHSGVGPETSAMERALYLDEWRQPGAIAAMLNWYRGAAVMVPPPGVTVPLPDFLLKAFPKVRVPTLVVWGMKDKALLPLQLDGLDALVEQLTIVRVPDAGHFVPWEKPQAVADALRPFLEGLERA